MPRNMRGNPDCLSARRPYYKIQRPLQVQKVLGFTQYKYFEQIYIMDE